VGAEWYCYQDYEEEAYEVIELLVPEPRAKAGVCGGATRGTTSRPAAMVTWHGSQLNEPLLGLSVLLVRLPALYPGAGRLVTALPGTANIMEHPLDNGVLFSVDLGSLK